MFQFHLELEINEIEENVCKIIIFVEKTVFVHVGLVKIPLEFLPLFFLFPPCKISPRGKIFFKVFK